MIRDTKTSNDGFRLVVGLTAIALLTVLATALAAPPRASADDMFGYDHDYQGRLAQGSMLYFGFDYKKTGKGKGKGKVNKLSIIYPFTCNEILTTMVIARFDGSFKMKNNKLALKRKKVKFRSFDGTDRFKANINFRAKFKGKKATGKFRMWFSAPGEGTNCTFGALDWRGRKGATVTPGPTIF